MYPVVGKFASSQMKCDVAPDLITNFKLFFFVVNDLCLSPGLFLSLLLIVASSILWIESSWCSSS